MACCTGQTNCNHIITIGYLKSFVGNDIQDANGNVVSVNHSDDTYCPTYAELTGGSLIPNGSDKGNGKWSQNVDGIIVGGSYAANQCVKQEDLSAIYTRFESFSITATPNTDIDECGNQTSTMSYTYMLRKYNKAMNSSCEVDTTSSTNSDTASTVSYTPSDNWASVSNSTVSFLKNGTHDAPARTVTITGSVNFRGTSHTDTANITQKALTGEYKYLTSYTEVYSYDSLTVSPTTFDCNGGYWTATGYYTNHNWDVYRWQDSCGVNYDSDKVNRNDTYPTDSESAGSGTAPFIDCESISETYSHTEPISYHGKSASWTQTCEPCGTPPTPCTCDSMRVWDEHYDYNEYDESGWDYILQVDDCCTIDYYAYNDYFKFKQRTESGYRRLYAIPKTENTGSSAKETYVSMTAYCGSNECVTSATITQDAYEPTPTCDCNDFSVDIATISTSYAGGSYHIPVTAYCGEIRTSVSDSTWAHVTSTSSTQVDFTVDSTSTARNNTITLSFYYNSTYMGCYSAVTVTQPDPPPGCQCSSLSVTPTALTLSSAASSSDSAYLGGVCGSITVEVPPSASSWLTAYYDSSNHYVYVTATTANNSGDPRSSYVTIKESGTDQSSCQKSLPVTQTGSSPAPCTCENGNVISAVTSSPVWTASETGTTYKQEIFRVPTCCTLTKNEFNSGSCSNQSAFWSTTSSTSDYKSYWVYMYSENTGSASRCAYLSITATCGSDTCSAYTIGTQEGTGSCDNCDAMNISVTYTGEGSSSSNPVSATGGSVTMSYTNNCGNVYVTSDSDITNPSYDRTNKTITFTVPSNSQQSTTSYTVYFSYSTNGTHCVEKTIYQAAAPPPTPGCDCSGLTLTRAPYSATPMSSSSHVGLEIGKFTKDSCITSYTVTTNDTWIKNLTVTEYQGYNITANFDENTATTENSGTVTINYTADTTSCSAKTFTVKQAAASPTPSKCDCDDADFRIRTRTVDVDSYSHFTQIPYTSTCGSVSAVVTTSGVDWITSPTTYGGNISFIISGNSGSQRQATIRVSHYSGATPSGTETCGTDITVTQYAESPSCNCTQAALTLSPSGLSFTNAGGTLSSDYTKQCGNLSYEVPSEYSSWITGVSINTTSNKVQVQVPQNDGEYRIGNVYLNIDGTYCKTLKVEQAAAPTCSCIDAGLQFSPTALTFSSASGTLSSNYSTRCGSLSASVPSEYSSWITGASVNAATHTIEVKVTENSGAFRVGNVYLYINGVYCDALRVEQAAPPTPCGTITISPDDATGNCSGGTVTFLHIP